MVLEADDEVIGLAHNDHVASGHSAVAGWRPSSTYFCDPPPALGFGLGQFKGWVSPNDATGRHAPRGVPVVLNLRGKGSGAIPGSRSSREHQIIQTGDHSASRRSPLPLAARRSALAVTAQANLIMP